MATRFPPKTPRWLAPLFIGLLGQAFMGRNDFSWTLWPGMFLLALSTWWFWRSLPKKAPENVKSPAPVWEWTLFTLLLLAALFFRCYRLNRIPAGIYLDAGGLGLGSERILKEGWRPFYEIYTLPITEQVYCYPLAGWFRLWGVSRLSLFSFSVFVSLLALPLGYWAFRKLGGPRVALAAVAVMAVVRWYLTFSRCGHPAFEAPFFLCGATAFWLLAVQGGRWWTWGACLAFLTAGCYGYRIFYAAPLLFGTWAAYEGLLRREKDRKAWVLRCKVFFGAFVFLTSPIWVYRFFGGRYDYWSKLDLWFLDRLKTEGLWALVSHLAGFALMFHRQADAWPVHNWSDHRVLDAVTGLLFLFGLAMALKNWRDRKAFYPLTGLLVMSLPALAGSADAPVNRTIGMFPFIAFLAGTAWEAIWSETRVLPGSFKAWKAVPFLLLAAAGALNFYAYFYLQSQQPGVCQAHWTDATIVGEELAKAPEKNIYLASKFLGNLDVDFLAFDKRADFRPLDSGALRQGSEKTVESPQVFVLDEGKTGWLQLLRKIYPGGVLESYEYFKGWPLVYFYRVPSGSPRWNGPLGGVQGTYRFSNDGSSPPVLTRNDPVLNFTFRNDFGPWDFKALSVRWTGSIVAPGPGAYSFLTLTTDSSAVVVDGHTVLQGRGSQEGTVFLRPGLHPIQIDFQKSSGVDTAFTLLWKGPGVANYQAVPFWEWKSPPKTAVMISKR